MDRVGSSPLTLDHVMARRARRERNQRIGAGLAVAAIFAAVLTWIGASFVDQSTTPADRPTGPPASEAFRTLALRACTEKQASLDGMDLRPPGFTQYSKNAVREIRRARGAYDEFVGRLVSLPLPPGDERAADLVALWERVPGRLDAVLDAARRGHKQLFESRLTALWPLLDRAFVASVGYGICTTEGR
jgi:hypothetical protein